MTKVSPQPPPPPIGFHYGKTDLERVGYFAEMGYIHGGGYIPPVTIPQIRDPKNRQMIPEFPKVRTGLQDCYFDKSYKRLFIGEAYFDPIKQAFKERMDQAKKIRGLFRPTSYTHLQASRGDYFGCFTTSMKAFDPRTRTIPTPDSKDAMKKLLQFIPSSPGKKGGYGYVDITINPYPRYIASPYDITVDKKIKDPNEKAVRRWLPPSPPGLFQSHYVSSTGYVRQSPAVWSLFGLFRPPNPAKSLGGCMDGCFDKWPTHSADHYKDPWKIQQGKTAPARKPKEETERPLVWFPNGKGKTNYTPSILQNKIRICTNATNWRHMEPVTYTREFI